MLDQFGEPYEVAIVAYALMLSKAATAETAFGILARHKRETGKNIVKKYLVVLDFFFSFLVER